MPTTLEAHIVCASAHASGVSATSHVFVARRDGAPVPRLRALILQSLFWCTRSSVRCPVLQVFKPYVGKEWRETPWLHGEIFFYHRILEATEWFSHKKDYFEPPKMRSLELAKQSILILTNAVAGGSRPTAAEEPEVLRKLIHSCLWGNKVDLCLFKVHHCPPDSELNRTLPNC